MNQEGVLGIVDVPIVEPNIIQSRWILSSSELCMGKKVIFLSDTLRTQRTYDNTFNK